MKVHFEELESRSRAMDVPVAPKWVGTVIAIIYALAASIIAFNMVSG